MGCELNDGLACWKLGDLYRTKENYLMAKRYFNKACELSDSIGCRKVGDLYLNGKGFVQDYSEAKKYYMKACDLNDSLGCEQYKELEAEDGFSIEISPNANIKSE